MTQKNSIVVFDLDDTLYKEVDFMKSAYMEIARSLEADCAAEDIVDKMMAWWREGENVFQRLIESCHSDLTVDDLLKIYRSHIPTLSLDGETKDMLQWLSERAVVGIITDGRSVTQHNKITALGLDAFMKEEDILVSGDRDNWEKPSELPFKHFMERYPSCTYYYIGDNLAKDFVAPNRLGWTTICLSDDGRNIHHQDFNLPQPMLPQHTISQIRETENLII